MTDTERGSLLEKLAKMKAHAASAKEIGNDAEAEAFAAKLQQLLMKHKLSLSDVDYAREMKEEQIVENHVATKRDAKGKRVYADAPDVEVRKVRVYWIETLAAVVARAYSCSIMVIPRSSAVVFVGHTSNVAIAEYLFVVLLRAAESLSWLAYGKYYNDQRRPGGDVTLARGYRTSWLTSFVHRIAQRMNEEREKIEREFRDSGSNSTTALARVDKEALAVKQYLDKYEEKAAPVSGRDNWNDDGWRDGKRAADAMNLKPNAMNAGSPGAKKALGN